MKTARGPTLLFEHVSEACVKVITATSTRRTLPRRNTQFYPLSEVECPQDATRPAPTKYIYLGIRPEEAPRAIATNELIQLFVGVLFRLEPPIEVGEDHGKKGRGGEKPHRASGELLVSGLR